MNDWEKYLSPSSPYRQFVDSRDRARSQQLTRAQELSDAYAAAVTAELRGQNQTLTKVLRALQRPLSTAASERLERGIYALRNGWDDDAIAELEESAKLDRYSPVTHLLLGILYSDLDQGRAAAALHQAFKYGVNDPPVAARAWLALGRADPAWVASTPVPPSLAFCPEVVLVKAAVTDREEDLRAALDLSPDLISAARAGGLQHTGSALVALVADPSSRIARTRHLLKLLDQQPLSSREEVMRVTAGWIGEADELRVTNITGQLSAVTSTLRGMLVRFPREVDRRERLRDAWESACEGDPNGEARTAARQLAIEVSEERRQEGLVLEAWELSIELEEEHKRLWRPLSAPVPG